MSTSRLPTLFIPHGGGPCFFMEWTMGPREEHLLPLMVAAGAAGNDLGRKIHEDRVPSVKVSAYQFG